MITDIFLEKRIKLFFGGNLITGIDSAINFDLVKCNKKFLHQKYNGKMDHVFDQKGKIF